MTVRSLPKVNAFEGLRGLDAGGLAPAAFERWNAGVRVANDSADNTISIYDVIGEDPWNGGGVTAKRVAAALRAIGPRDVVVNINSPGGALFEGIAIYNLLREHPHAVTTKVVGLAASAASIVAMAGDKVEIAKSAFLMIHNAWVLAVGNRHDLRAIADTLEPFDGALADIYAAKTGAEPKAMAALMDKETWLNGSTAVEQKFADALLASDQVEDNAKAAADLAPVMAAHRLDIVLARQGMPRSERRKLIKDLKAGMPGAADLSAMPSAGDRAFVAEVQRAIATLIN